MHPVMGIEGLGANFVLPFLLEYYSYLKTLFLFYIQQRHLVHAHQ